jgi:hypothetical protein
MYPDSLGRVIRLCLSLGVAPNAVNRCYCFFTGVVCHLRTYVVCLPQLRRSGRRLRTYSRS